MDTVAVFEAGDQRGRVDVRRVETRPDCDRRVVHEEKRALARVTLVRQLRLQHISRVDQCDAIEEGYAARAANRGKWCSMTATQAFMTQA